VIRRLRLAMARWHASGSTAELQRLRVLRYDAIRLPVTEATLQRVETLDHLIEIEMGAAQRLEQRIAALGAM
jgi:hypothetical protein